MAREAKEIDKAKEEREYLTLSRNKSVVRVEAEYYGTEKEKVRA